MEYASVLEPDHLENSFIKTKTKATNFANFGKATSFPSYKQYNNL